MTSVGGIVGFIRIDDEFSEAFDLATSKLSGFGRAFTNAGQSMTLVGAGITAAVTVPIVGGLTAAAEAAISFETAFANVAKVLNPTTAEAAHFKTELREMAQVIPATREELAKFASIGGQFGISKEGIIDFTRSVAMLDTAVDGISGEEAAAGLAQISKITHVAEKDFLRLADVLVDLGNKGSSTESEILEFTRRLAGAGQTVGMTAQEIFGVGAAMANVGIHAEAGGSAMSKIISDLDRAVAHSGEKLDQFAEIAGMSSQKFADKFRDEPVKALEAFIEGLGQVEKNGGNLTLVLDDMSIKSIRQTDMLKRLAGAQGEMTLQVQNATTAWDQHKATTEEFNTKAQTTENQWKMLKSAITEVAVEIGNVILPVLKSLMANMRPVIDAAQEMAKMFAALPAPIQMATFAALGLVAALGPIITLAGGMFLVFGTIARNTGAIMALTEVLGKTAVSTAAVNAASTVATTSLNTFGFSAVTAGATLGKMALAADGTSIAVAAAGTESTTAATAIGGMTGPIGLVVTAIGLMAVAWGNYKDDWTRSFDVLIPPLGMLRTGIDELTESHSPLASIMRTIGSIIESVVIIAWEKLKTKLSEISELLKRDFQDAMNQAKTVLTSLTNLLTSQLVPVLTQMAQTVILLYGVYLKLKGEVAAVDLGLNALSEDLKNQAKAAQAANAPLASLGTVLGSLAPLMGAVRAQGSSMLGSAVSNNATALTAQLAATTATVSSFTKEQKDNIAAGVRMGLTNKELIAAMKPLFPTLNLTNEALDLYKKRQNEASAAGKAAQKVTADIAKANKEEAKSVVDEIEAQMKEQNARIDDFQRAQDASFQATTQRNKSIFDEAILRKKALDKQKEDYMEYQNWLGLRRMEDDARELKKNDLFAGVGTSMLSAMQELPQLLISSFTGGGGVGGAFKALGITFAKSITEPIQKALAAYFPQLNSAINVGVAGATAIGGAFGGETGALIGSIASGIAGVTLAASGAITSSVALGAATMGIGAAAVGVYLLARHYFSVSKEIKAARKESESFQEMLHETLSEARLLEAGTQKWLATVLAVQDIFKGIGKSALEANNVVAMLWDTDHPDEVAKAMAIITLAMAELKRNTAIATTAAEQLYDVLIEGGGTIPDDLFQQIGYLHELGLVSDELFEKFRGLGYEGEVSWEKMQEAAEKYGIELGALGPRFNDLRITDAATSLWNDFDMLTRGGADVGGTLFGMREEISALVRDAQRMGIALPEQFRPLVTELLRSGNLLDDEGEALTTLGELKFGDPIVAQFQAIADIIQTLIDKILGIPSPTVNLPGGGDPNGPGAPGAGDWHPPGTAGDSSSYTPPPINITIPGDNRTLTVNVAIDGAEVARAVIEHLGPEVRILGGG